MLKSWVLLLLIFLAGCTSPEEKKNKLLIDGNAALRASSYRVALQHYKDALEIDSCYADAFNNMGVLYAERNNSARAIEYYSQALNCDQYFIPAYLNRAKLLYETHQLYMALDDLSYVDRLKPDSAYVIFSIGLVNTRLRDYEEALVNFNHLLTLDPGNPEALVNRATIYYYQKRYDLAEADFRMALNNKISEAEAWNGLSLIDVNKGKLSEALAKMNTSVNLQPREPYYLNNRGYVRLLIGDLEGAEEDINESIAIDSRNAWAYRNKGWYYYLTDQKEDALRLLLQSYNMDPFVERTPYMLGVIYSENGDLFEACKWFEIGKEAEDEQAEIRYSGDCRK